MSFWTTTKRVARYGLIGFIRNGFVSLAAILVMTITLLVLAGMLISGAALSSVLQQLTDNVDVTVYFTTTTTPDQMMQTQQAVEALPEVASTTLVTADEALSQFEARHANDQLTMQALQELGSNPLEASLEIRAKDTSQYQTIATYLSNQQSNGTAVGQTIDTINYYQNETAITRLANLIDAARSLSIGIAFVLGIASLLIAFNTIRLAIYTSRDEIGVMNLVGASHWYVRGPFVIAGILYGVISGLLVLLLLYPLTLWLGPGSQQFFGTFNVYDYYLSAFPTLFLVVMGSGIALGALSSFLAVRRYLNS